MTDPPSLGISPLFYRVSRTRAGRLTPVWEQATVQAAGLEVKPALS